MTYIDELMALSPERVKLNESMALHTTFRVGGPADCCFFPKSAEEIIKAMEIARVHGVGCFVMGNGSNLIVRDRGLRGLVIILSDAFSVISVDGNTVTAQAGAPLAKVANAAMEHSLSGLEFASGIPGSVGGGVAMNAGAYGGEIKDVLVYADVLRDGRVIRCTRDGMEMGYRSTRVLREGSIVLSACFGLAAGDKALIREKMSDLNARRRDKQPLNYPSAGSTFKRPEGYFAGALIEQASLKGVSIGGAQVSEKHAGFIINKGGATAEDILALIKHVQDEVYASSGVRLETEVRVIGE